MAQRLVAGIDFGGTKIRTAVVDEAGQIAGDVVDLPTRATRPAEEIVGDMVRSVRLAADKAGTKIEQLAGLGVGSPGPLDLEKGDLLTPPNLPTMWDFPLRARLEEALGIPVRVNNDGNCFVLGEAIFGAAKGARIVVGVTLGTGFGCGIVVDRKIFAGATGTAAEVWCSPYKDGTFEEYGSAKGLVRRYRELTGLQVDGAEIYRRARAGESAALEAWQRYGEDLGTILSYLVNVLDPDVIVAGGSVIAGWDLFAPSALEALRSNINPRPRQHVRLVPAALGDMAGVLGAAALFLAEM